jgi:hypothetical protein
VLDYPTGIGSPGTPLAKLGAPPAPGSAREQHDVATSRALIAQRTPEGDAWARAMDQHGGTAVWRELAAQVQGMDPAVAQSLVGAALSAASTQAGLGKHTWMRQRPFQVDPSITVIGRTPKLADSSYPSGHSARAFAAARILAVLDPSVANSAYAMAREVAYSRMYAGVHFASDTVAGAKLGTAIADSVIERWRDGTLDMAPVDGIDSLRAA